MGRVFPAFTLSVGIGLGAVGSGIGQGPDLLELRDAAGSVRGRIGNLGNGAFGVEIFDAGGAPRLRLKATKVGSQIDAFNPDGGVAFHVDCGEKGSDLRIGNDGHSQLRARVGEDGASVSLVDGQGRECAGLAGDAAGDVSTFHLASQPEAGEGAASFRVESRPGQTKLKMSAGDLLGVECGSVAKVGDYLSVGSQESGVTLESRLDGMSRLEVRHGKAATALGGGPKAGGGLTVMNPDGKQVVHMGFDGAGELKNLVRDAKGNPVPSSIPEKKQ